MVDHALQIAAARLFVPADPALAGGHAPSWARVLHASQHLRAGMDQIAQMRAERDRVSQVVVAAHQFPKEEPLLFALHRFEHDGFEGADLAFENGCGFAGGADRHARAAADWFRGALGRQLQHALAVEQFEKFAAFARLESAVAALPLEQFAHRVRQLHAA